MQLIPSLVLQSLQNPAHVQQLFINYIKKANLTITNSKTIATVAYFHKRAFTVGQTSTTFFSGAFDSTETNVPGNSFVRPESEHFLIWAIRVECNIASLKNSVWIPGVNLTGFLNNTVMTLTTNSEVKLKKFPLSEALSDLTVRDNGIIPLSEPIFWGGQQELSAVVENAENTVAPANQYMKMTLIGLALI